MPLFSSGPSVDSVISRLGSTKDSTAHYIAVSEYVESKKRRGKGVAEVNTKLDDLERALAKVSERLAADTAGTFAKIRDDKGLPRSKLFPSAAAPAPEVAPPPAYPAYAAPPPPVPAAPVRVGSVSRAAAPPSPPTTYAAAPAPAAPSYAAVAPPARAGSPAALILNGEEQLAMLRDYDTVFLVDDSGSMAGSLWREARAAIQGVVAHAIKYDEDGIDIYFLNDRSAAKGVKSVGEVEALFNRVRPSGATPTGARLDKLLKEYKRELDAAYEAGKRSGGDMYTVKPLNLLVITDGAPTDDPESAIVSFAKYLDKYDFPLSQCGIQMFQIGSDPEATEALQDLDDALENRYNIRDIVDTVPYAGAMTAEMIVKVLLGGINRRLDRRNA
ncbi:uncharacterized protein LOC62_04G006418 [Vanrija pseudolonga]|uniref:VWFA domain-containing protein n=1 Tax=Vanrija pseudolonga TaxID=143232 RepID=A0AAF0YA37_9TREE|nr:hypothetical protein LOC62_04G006418 [Vanrija pseudolonga]